MRWVILLTIIASGATAQEIESPTFDPSVLDTCPADAAIRDKSNCVGKAAAQCIERQKRMLNDHQEALTK